jgi:hypothetical protein
MKELTMIVTLHVANRKQSTSLVSRCCFSSKIVFEGQEIFSHVSANRRRMRRRNMQDEEIGQKLFLDIGLEDEILSMTMAVTKTRNNETTHSGLTRHQMAGSDTRSALVTERDAAQVSGVSREGEAGKGKGKVPVLN